MMGLFTSSLTCQTRCQKAQHGTAWKIGFLKLMTNSRRGWCNSNMQRSNLQMISDLLQLQGEMAWDVGGQLLTRRDPEA